MTKTDPTLAHAIREYARSHPDEYKKIAISFGTSEINVKRICKGIRGKNWRLGRKSANPDEDKFWKRVDKTSDGCWMWTGSLTDDGYGNVWYDGKCQGAHRVAYEITFGPIPEGKELDHKCRIRACCNPDHLTPMTHERNMELVRSQQAKQTRFTACHSPGLTDTGSLIDTRVKAKPEARFDLAHPFINEDKINHVAPSTGRVSVSMEPGSSSPAQNAIAEHADVDLDRVADMDAPGEVGSTCSVQAYVKRPAELCFYQASSVGDGIRVKILARSKYDAEEKFTSVWGKEPTVRVEKLEGPVDEKVAAVRLSMQERELASEFDHWKHSADGQRYFARVGQDTERQKEAQEAEDARCQEQEMEEAMVRIEAEQEDLRQQAERERSRRFPGTSPARLPRYAREPSYRSAYDREYYGEEGHEL